MDVLKKLLEPSFTMFENMETQVTVDEYGASIDDLNFKDIQSIDTKWCISIITIIEHRVMFLTLFPFRDSSNFSG